jgi:hypothetical protein
MFDALRAFFIIVLMFGAVDAQKPEIVLEVFFPQEMLVRLVNFEYCHSPLHL